MYNVQFYASLQILISEHEGESNHRELKRMHYRTKSRYFDAIVSIPHHIPEFPTWIPSARCD